MNFFIKVYRKKIHVDLTTYLIYTHTHTHYTILNSTYLIIKICILNLNMSNKNI